MSLLVKKNIIFVIEALDTPRFFIVSKNNKLFHKNMVFKAKTNVAFYLYCFIFLCQVFFSTISLIKQFAKGIFHLAVVC